MKEKKWGVLEQVKVFLRFGRETQNKLIRKHFKYSTIETFVFLRFYFNQCQFKSLFVMRYAMIKVQRVFETLFQTKAA